MDLKYPREQESIDTEMLDAVRSICWMLSVHKAKSFPKPATGTVHKAKPFPKPSTGTVPGPGRPLPRIPAKSLETRTAHDTIPSTKGSKLELQMAEEDVENLAGIARRNTGDGPRNLREELETAREENQSLREGLKCRESEAKEILRRENAKYNQLYNTMTNQLEDAQAENGKVEEIARKTHLKLQAKEEELQKCKDELFALQPLSPISDAQIGHEWERLCGAITQWIDDQAGGMGSLQSELKRLNQRDEFNDTIDLYWGADRQELALRSSRYPNIIDVLLRYNIHCLLEKRVFDESVYMFGLGSKSAKLLTMIEEQMNALEPRRGNFVLLRYNEEKNDLIAHRSTDYRQMEIRNLDRLVRHS